MYYTCIYNKYKNSLHDINKSQFFFRFFGLILVVTKLATAPAFEQALKAN